MFNIKKVDNLDYEEICNWWKKQNFPVLPQEMLSPNGFIVKDDKENRYAALWIFKTDSPIYIMEWIVGNPDVDYGERGEALDILIDYASTWAKENGAKALFTMAQHERLKERYKNKQFQVTDENMTHFMRRL